MPSESETSPLPGEPRDSHADGSGTVRSPSPGPPGWTDSHDPAGGSQVPPPAGRYHALYFHRRGGMGEVWCARDTELERAVAFKVIRPRYADDEAARRRFVFEAELTGRLEHPAIIPVYGLGRDGAGRPYYAMRFVQGESLQEKIAALHAPGGPTGAERAVELRRLLNHFVTVCRAVDYAHSRGVIHRDLKPANVMAGAYGETLVLDWGIAKRLRAPVGEAEAPPAAEDEPEGRPFDPTRSLKGTKLGSPAYWSPEQAAGRPDLHDERTDVYGLGSILFAILTGRVPHPDGVPPPEPPSARALRDWVDAGIDEVARRAMAHDPADRYASSAELAQAVELWLADQPLVAQRGAVAALAKLMGDAPDDFALVEHLARQRSNLGLMLAGMGRGDEAEAELRAAADSFARLAEARKKPRFLADQANCLLAVARSLAARGRDAEAQAAQRAAAAVYRHLIAAEPDEYRENYVTLALPPGVLPHVSVAEPEQFPTIAPLAPPPFAAPQAAPTEPESERTGVLSRAAPTPGPVPGADTPEADAALPEAASEWDKTVPPPNLPVAAGGVPPVPDTDYFPPEGARPGGDGREQALDLSGGYTLLGQLASGGMGVLYLARDNVLRRQVVIKALHARTAAEPDLQARFVNEMRITAALQHPNVVRVYTCGTRRDGVPFMVLEYLNGVTLTVLLNAQGPGWTHALLDPLAQSCDGLHYAHSRGVVHRDAKLSNIVVTPAGRAVLLDWGIAKVLEGHDGHGAFGEEPAGGAAEALVGDPMLTHAGTVMGTPAYMSPEQARGDAAAISPRSDVFTIGADIFHLATGRPPGVGDRVPDVLLRLINGDIPRLRDARLDAPAELDAICARAMAFRPEDRYPTAAALAADIREFLAKQPLGEL